MPSAPDDRVCQSPDPANTLTYRLNQLLRTGGDGYSLSLCPGQRYIITQPLAFTAPNQEISTQGYPTGERRATLVVAGPTGHTTAVNGTCANCDHAKLRNIQIDGARNGHSGINGGANIEMGGNNSGQLVEYVRSYDPRSWSCLSVSEGPLTCSGVIVRNNDIGPCGSNSDAPWGWTDGISLSCADSVVQNNVIVDATGGGIVVSGSPGSSINNNRVSVEKVTCRSGISMVNYEPWDGNYTNTVVQENTILGGFASKGPDSLTQLYGENDDHVIIKIGIAIGLRTWFGTGFQVNDNYSGTVSKNRLSGAFGFGIAITTARNFTVEDNFLFGNTNFIGSPGPCKYPVATTMPNARPFVVDKSDTEGTTLQTSFVDVPDGNSLACISPPNGGDNWPFHDIVDTGGLSRVGKIGVALGAFFAMCIIAVVSYGIRRANLKRRQRGKGVVIKLIQNP